MSQKPSIGRIVRFVDIAGGESAAIITKVLFFNSQELVNLTVFPDRSDPYTASSVVYKEDSDFPAHLTWHWPPRD